MNPLATEALASIVRSILKIGAGYLIAKGVWSAGDASTYVEAAALAVVSLGWSCWKTYSSRLKLMTALVSDPGTTEKDVEQTIASGARTPSTMTAKTDIPLV